MLRSLPISNVATAKLIRYADRQFRIIRQQRPLVYSSLVIFLFSMRYKRLSTKPCGWLRRSEKKIEFEDFALETSGYVRSRNTPAKMGHAQGQFLQNVLIPSAWGFELTPRFFFLFQRFVLYSQK